MFHNVRWRFVASEGCGNNPGNIHDLRTGCYYKGVAMPRAVKPLTDTQVRQAEYFVK